MGKFLLFLTLGVIGTAGIGLYYWVTRKMKWEKVNPTQWKSRPPGYRIEQTGDTHFKLYHPEGKNKGFLGDFDTLEIAQSEADKHHVGPK